MHPESPSDPERTFVTIDSKQVAFTDEGSGPLIVAVPGLPGSSRDFRWLAPTLSHAFRIVRFEPPGFGGSHRTNFRGQTVAERALELESFVVTFDEPVCLLTHSAGATIAAELAVRRPDLIDRCVFIAPPGSRPHFPQRTYQLARYTLHNSLVRATMLPVLKGVYRLTGFPGYLTDNERAFATLDASMMDFSAHGRTVERMTQPTLVAWAGDDKLIPDAFSQSIFERVENGTKLRFESGGHGVQKTMATELGIAIEAFLKPIESSAKNA